MKASSKTALAVLVAMLVLMAGIFWYSFDASRPTASEEEPGSERSSAERRDDRPGPSASSLSRPRSVAFQSAPASPPDAAAAARGASEEGANEPDVHVRGRILDRLRRPVAGAAVVVRADLLPGMSTNSARTESDSEGRFAVASMKPGQLLVEAEHPGTDRGIGGPVRAGPGTTHEVDVMLGRGFVRGTVVWEDGAPAAGLIVRGTVRGRMSLTAETDAAGRYEVGPFAAAEVHLNAAPEADPVGAGADSARVVVVAWGDDLAPVTLVIPRREHQVSGVVLSTEGVPLAAIPIGIVRRERAPVFRSSADALRGGGNYAALSDGHGAFVVRGLPGGTFTVWASKAEHPDAEARGVKAGATGVRLQFLRGASLSGRTVDRAGEPCGAYQLYLSRVAPGEVPDFSTPKSVPGGDGTFAFSALSAGTYELLAVTPGGQIGRLRDIRRSEGQSREGLALVVDEGAQVRGRAILADTEQPLAGVWLGSSIPGARARTDAAGFFVFQSMPSGSFQIHVPNNPRTMGAQDELVTVPVGTRQLDVGVFRVRRKPDP
jgi:hypothetical protein